MINDIDAVEKISPQLAQMMRAVDELMLIADIQKKCDVNSSQDNTFNMSHLMKTVMLTMCLGQYGLYLRERTFSEQLKYLIYSMEQKEITFNKKNLIEEALKQTGR